MPFLTPIGTIQGYFSHFKLNICLCITITNCQRGCDFSSDE